MKITEVQKQMVLTAVQDAESKTSGELVPMVVAASDDYNEVSLLLGAFLALVVVPFIFEFSLFHLDLMKIHFCQVFCFVLGLLLGKIPLFKRVLTPRSTRNRLVLARARQAFYDQGVYKTKEASGILIFISKLEHQVVILGDEGIDAKLGTSFWESEIQTIVCAIKKGDMVKGLVAAIENCGHKLAEHFPIQPDDKNELRDHLVIE